VHVRCHSGLGSDSRVLASTITKDPACAWSGMCWLPRRCGIGCHRAVFRVWLLAGFVPLFRAAAEAEAELCLASECMFVETSTEPRRCLSSVVGEKADQVPLLDVPP